MEAEKVYEEGPEEEAEIETVFTDILIMGAGMAGISAAKRLSEHGINKVVVVEGSDRVGGRVKDVKFGGITVEVGANWVHFSNMKEHELNPIELLVKDAKLNFIEDDYQDLIFRYRGKIIGMMDLLMFSFPGANVTAEYNQLYSRLYKAVKSTVDVAKRKDEGNEPDISFRAALALADWRPTHPLEKAAEYFEFDFEFGDEPENTGIKSNAKVTVIILMKKSSGILYFRCMLSIPRMIFSLLIQKAIPRYFLIIMYFITKSAHHSDYKRCVSLNTTKTRTQSNSEQVCY